MKVTFRLGRRNGLKGPYTTVEMPDDTHRAIIRQQARQWAAKQLGNPWDILTYERNGQVYTVAQL